MQKQAIIDATYPLSITKSVASRSILILLAVGLVAVPSGQTFSSGSEESDGALNVLTGSAIVTFDPFDTDRWTKVLDPDGDGVYHFTTITIASGTTLRVKGDKVNRPVYWLASGPVEINGTLDLSGGSSTFMSTADPELRRQLTVPGAGGYGGGAGGRTTPLAAPTPGDGPGGGTGQVTVSGCTSAGFVSCGKGGLFTGNRFAVPLLGGSGGEGAIHPTLFGANGGAGGGAILIASSTSINVTGQINASGGGNFSFHAGGGSGGSIRLVAPTITGSGSLLVNGGPAGGGIAGVPGGNGWVRLEGNSVSTSMTVSPAIGALTRGSPMAGTVRPSSSLRITAIDGLAVPPNPRGSYQFPDVTISNGAPVDVQIEATGIPPGTVVTLKVYPETPSDALTVQLPTTQATLAGTLQFSTATATFTFPFGFSRGFIRANWTN
jgi:hypothetical protein